MSSIPYGGLPHEPRPQSLGGPPSVPQHKYAAHHRLQGHIGTQYRWLLTLHRAVCSMSRAVLTVGASAARFFWASHGIMQHSHWRESCAVVRLPAHALLMPTAYVAATLQLCTHYRGRPHNSKHVLKRAISMLQGFACQPTWHMLPQLALTHAMPCCRCFSAHCTCWSV